jgi:hypothetical protein
MFRLDPYSLSAQTVDAGADGNGLFIIAAALLLLLALAQFGKVLQPLREVLRAMFAAVAAIALVMLALVLVVGAYLTDVG